MMVQRWLKFADRIVVWMATLAGVTLTGLALFTMVNITMRYVFNAPIVGSNDVVELALVVMSFLALPYAGRSAGNIIVDLVPDYPSKAVTAWRDAIGKALAAVIFGLLAWQGWVAMGEKAASGESSNMIEIPLSPFYFVLFAGCAIYTVTLLLEFINLVVAHHVSELRDGLEDGQSDAG